MTFKHGSKAEILLGSLTTAQDLSPYLYTADWHAYCAAAKSTTFKKTWDTFIPGVAHSQLAGYGYYDPAQTAVRTTLQAAAGIATYGPAGATAIGDFTRLISFNTSQYKESPVNTNTIPFTWLADTTDVVGFGVSLHPLAQEAVGTVTGTGDGILTSTSSSTGGIGHLHLTAYTSGTHSFKFQDATTLGGTYADITAGAFTNMTAVGSQRLVISGTIRQFVRCVATIGTTAATYAVSFART